MGRAAHDIGLAAILGGNLFARVGMHPAVRAVADPRERGVVVTRAWRRYGAVNGLGLAAVVANWVGARSREARPQLLSARERKIAAGKDAAVAMLTASGLLSAALGIRFAHMETDGAVPLRSGDRPAPGASDREATTKRLLNLVGAINLASACAVAVASAALAQANYRRPPVRRIFRRSY